MSATDANRTAISMTGSTVNQATVDTVRSTDPVTGQEITQEREVGPRGSETEKRKTALTDRKRAAFAGVPGTYIDCV